MGLRPFPWCPQGPRGAPAARDWDLPPEHLMGTEAPMPKHLQEPRSPWPALSPSGIPFKIKPQIPFLRQSLEFFVKRARKDSTFQTLQPAWRSAGSGAGLVLDGLNHFKSCFCCTWWAHPKFTTPISGS